MQPHGDHRLAMALAVAGLAAQGRCSVQRRRSCDRILPRVYRRCCNAWALVCDHMEPVV